jgi:hypothetical protein
VQTPQCLEGPAACLGVAQDLGEEEEEEEEKEVEVYCGDVSGGRPDMKRATALAALPNCSLTCRACRAACTTSLRGELRRLRAMRPERASVETSSCACAWSKGSRCRSPPLCCPATAASR